MRPMSTETTTTDFIVIRTADGAAYTRQFPHWTTDCSAAAGFTEADALKAKSAIGRNMTIARVEAR